MFKINETLRNDVLGSMPDNYNNLEKAMYIYNALCTKFYYSMDYYLDVFDPDIVEKFTNIDNLQYLDGVKNREVICYTVNAVFRELLEQVGCCEYISPLPMSDIKPNHIVNLHDIVRLTIDGKKYSIDSTSGVLVNSDLMNAKYSTGTLVGWDVDNRDEQLTDEQVEILEDEIFNAQDKVRGNIIALDKNIHDYKKLKYNNDTYMSLPVESRVMMLLELAVANNEYNLTSFNYLIKLRDLFFNYKELGMDERGIKTKNQDKQKIELFFCYDDLCDEFKAFLLFNPKGYSNIAGMENLDDLEIYEISFKDKTINGKNFDINKIKEFYGNKSIDFNDERRYFFRPNSHEYFMNSLKNGFFLTRRKEYIVDALGEKRVPLLATKIKPNTAPVGSLEDQMQ